MLDQLKEQETAEIETELPEPEADQEEQAEQPVPDDQAEDDGEIVVSFGDAEEQEQEEPAPAWVKELRKQSREVSKQNRELKAKLRALEEAQKPSAPELGPKPTLEAMDYDAEKFEAALLDWTAKKAEADKAAEAKKAEQEAAERQWQERVQTYSQQKAALNARDFDDAEDNVREAMTVTQQGIILQAADDPAKLVYALGKDPAKAAELAAIKDPVRFAATVARMELQLKVTKRKPAVTPEARVSGAGKPPAANDARLQTLKAEAERTGDFTQYFALKRKLKGS